MSRREEGKRRSGSQREGGKRRSGSQREAPRARNEGLTILELTITIAMTGLLAVGLSGLLRHPLSAREAVGRRAEMVEIAEIALTRLTRDIEYAVPKSVRVAGGGVALELMSATHAGPYRATEGVNDPGGPGEQDHSADSDRLTLSADTSFNALGRIANRSIAYGAAMPWGTRVVVGPTSPATLWDDAAANRDPGSITPGSTVVRILDDGDEDQIQLASAHTFSGASVSRRFYFTDAPVSYVWDAAERSLWRVTGYGTHSTQPSDRSAAPLSTGSAALAAVDVERCTFSYDPGSSAQGGLVTVELVIESGGERVRLLEQVEVRHAP